MRKYNEAEAAAYYQGRRDAQAEVARIIEICGATNADDILDGNDATDGILDWISS